MTVEWVVVVYVDVGVDIVGIWGRDMEEVTMMGKGWWRWMSLRLLNVKKSDVHDLGKCLTLLKKNRVVVVAGKRA